jgi:competence protein ComEC
MNTLIAAADLRLAGLAVAAWLSALAGLYLSATAGAFVAAAAAVLAVTIAVVRHRFAWLRAGGWTAVAMLLGIVCGAGATAPRVAVRDAPALATLTASRTDVTASVIVRDDPRQVARATGRPMYLVPAELRWVRDDEHRIATSARVLVLGSHAGWATPLPGQRLTVDGRLARARGGDLRAAVLSTSSAPIPVGRPSWAQRAAGSLRTGLQRACTTLPAAPGGLLPGLVVGDTSRLDPAVEADFKTTGLTHLTAVSGANVAIVVGAVLLLATRARAAPWLAGLLCGLALAGFVILARPSPSVVRAAAMGAIGLVGLATGRPRSALPALAAAVAGLVAYDPELAADAGFTLSVLATAGLLFLAPRWSEALRRRGVPRGLAEALAIPAAAQLACAPVIGSLSGTISIVAIPANLLAAPAVAPATVLGVAATVLSAAWPTGAAYLAWVAHWPAWWLVLVARYGAAVPASAVPWPSGVGGGLLLAALTVVGVLAMRRQLARRLVAVVAAAVVVGALPVRMLASGWPPTGWAVVACAVGQGDMLVLPVAAGSAVVVDAGPDPAAADRCLRRLGVHAVPLLVVTHFHVDHIGGLSGVFRSRTVDAVVTSAWSQPRAGYDAVSRTAGAAPTPVTTVPDGWRYAAGAVHLAVLGLPYPITGTRSDPNNNSLVMHADIDGVSVLLAGDAETEEQSALLDRYGPAPLRAVVLKVPHHGSSYQDAAFLDAADPAVAMVPVGKDNEYGHPNAAVLAKLARDGARVLRTDQDGDVAVVRRGSGVGVVISGHLAALPPTGGAPPAAPPARVLRASPGRRRVRAGSTDPSEVTPAHGGDPPPPFKGLARASRPGVPPPVMPASRRRSARAVPAGASPPGGSPAGPTLRPRTFRPVPAGASPPGPSAPVGPTPRRRAVGAVPAGDSRPSVSPPDRPTSQRPAGTAWRRRGPGVAGSAGVQLSLDIAPAGRPTADVARPREEGWRISLATALERRAAREAARQELAERRRVGLGQRRAARSRRRNLSGLAVSE